MQSLFQDENYLTYLETFITESRKEGFKRVLANRTKHFTVVCEDVYQLHNTSAVMRSCEVFGIQELNVVEYRFGKKIDKEIALGAEKWVDVNGSTRRDAVIGPRRPDPVIDERFYLHFTIGIWPGIDPDIACGPGSINPGSPVKGCGAASDCDTTAVTDIVMDSHGCRFYNRTTD